MENQEPHVGVQPPAEARGLESPLFYFSHVSPSTESDDGPHHDDDPFRTFFEHLSLAVAQRTQRPGAAAVGYLADDRTTDDDRARALAVCQVFVPLLSPLYFRDERCGRDWQSFRSRVPSAVRADRFVPVIWTPVKAVNIPRGLVGSEIGPIHEERPDAANGLYSLLIGGDEEQYNEVVAEVASTVAAATRAAPLAAVHPADLTTLPSAFETPPHLLTLRILILAPTEGHVPPTNHAPAGAYGARQRDWAPYGASWGRTLAADVEEIAERQGYRPEIADFDEATVAALRCGRLPAAPTVLVIDNWALLDEASCARVRQYLAMEVPWQLFMVVREPPGPEAELRVGVLRNAVNATLEQPLAHMRIDIRHVASGEVADGLALDFALIAGVAAGRFRKDALRNEGEAWRP